MAKLVFYRQARADGGIRTGIDIDGSPEFENFVEGSSEHDPALTWFVDVRCEGELLPADKDAAWKWFADHSSFFRTALSDVAAQLELGIDSEVLPYQTQISGPDPGISVEIALSAIRRLQARQVAVEIRAIADQWDELMTGMLPQSSLGRTR